MAKVITQVQAQRKNSSSNSQSFTPEEYSGIQQIAYELYVQRGYENGHDVEDWLRAETIIHNRRKN